MTHYKEIEDPARLKQLSDLLTSRLRKQLKYRKTREIGYPGGKAEAVVNFGGRHGQSVPWWSSELSTNGEAYINLVGRGDPESKASLMIELQFNVPVKEFSRRHGGAFVEDVESGAVVLAHRGIVTRGNARINKDALFRETTATTTLVGTLQGDKRLYLVASLDSTNLVDEITEFAEELRRAAEAVAANKEDTGAKSALVRASRKAERIDGKLSEYFDEFSGKRKLPPKGAVVVNVRHGGVVRQLRKQLEQVGTAMKSQKIDLAILKPKTVLLFEVKTSVSPTDLYTAIGQLFLHALVVEEQYAGRDIQRILVIPEGPDAKARRRIEEGLGIQVLTYRWKAGGNAEFEKHALAEFAAI